MMILFTMKSEGLKQTALHGKLDFIEKQSEQFGWANYPLGVLQELKKRKLAPEKGFHLYFSSNLPTAVGLSSSAALELATALTLLQLANKDVDRHELVNLCRDAENKFVGMPCGILDQGTSAFGQKNRLVKIDCKEQSYETIDLPARTKAWIFDTGIKHDLVDSLYSVRHRECKDALAVINAQGSDFPHLALVSKNVLDNSSLETNLYKRATHVCDEHARVTRFCLGLESGESPESLGEILHKSHRSSSQNFQNSCPELDCLVELLSTDKKVHGARLTGGGFGGAVVAWTQDQFNRDDAQLIADNFHKRVGRKSEFYPFSPSSGARKES
jgi:galactokinase